MIFTTSKTQDTKITSWKKEHECNFRSSVYGIENEIYVGAIGGALEYCFTPTGIGITCIIKCACGEKLDLTDYEDW